MKPKSNASYTCLPEKILADPPNGLIHGMDGHMLKPPKAGGEIHHQDTNSQTEKKSIKVPKPNSTHTNQCHNKDATEGYGGIAKVNTVAVEGKHQPNKKSIPCVEVQHPVIKQDQGDRIHVSSESLASFHPTPIASDTRNNGEIDNYHHTGLAIPNHKVYCSTVGHGCICVGHNRLGGARCHALVSCGPQSLHNHNPREKDEEESTSHYVASFPGTVGAARRSG